MAFGAVVQLVAIFMISLCKEYYQFFLGKLEHFLQLSPTCD